MPPLFLLSPSAQTGKQIQHKDDKQKCIVTPVTTTWLGTIAGNDVITFTMLSNAVRRLKSKLANATR